MPRGGLIPALFERLLQARAAVFFFFMLEGYFNSLWSVYLPLQQEELELSDSLIGGASLFNYGGQVVSTLATAALLRRVGARTAVLFGAVLFSCSMFAIPQAHSFAMLCVVFGLFGTTEGIMDVSMNANAVLTETVADRPLLGMYHGSYSVAAAVGGLLGGVFVDQGLNQQSVYTVSGGLGIAFAVLSFLQLYPLEQEKELTLALGDVVEAAAAAGSVQAAQAARAPVAYSSVDVDQPAPASSSAGLPSSSLAPAAADKYGPLVLLAGVGFLAAAGEGAVVTWVAIFFTRSFSWAPGGLYSLGFTCFMSCMALGRFCCDWLRQLVGRQVMFRAAGLLAGGGVCIIAAAPSALPEPGSLFMACLGCCITGLGLSTLIPTVFSSAGHLPNVHPGTAISRVATWTYAGSIVSPPLIGALSDAFHSLQLGFVVLAALLFLISPLGARVPPEPRAQQAGSAGTGTGTGAGYAASAGAEDKQEVDVLRVPLLPKA